jgi:hypothetical protein
MREDDNGHNRRISEAKRSEAEGPAVEQRGLIAAMARLPQTLAGKLNPQASFIQDREQGRATTMPSQAAGLEIEPAQKRG